MRVKSKLLASALTVGLIVSSILGGSTVKAEQAEIGVIVNGKQAVFDVPARVENGRTLVPMAKVFEMLGAVVTWDAGTATATATKGDKSITIRFDGELSHDVKVNGQPATIGVAPLEVPPKIVNGRTLVPLAFVSEALGAKVFFNQDLYTVFVVTPMVLGPVEKHVSFSLSQDEAYNVLNEEGYIMRWRDQVDLGVDVKLYSPSKNTFLNLPFNMASYGMIDNKIYYTPKEGDKEIRLFNPETMLEERTYKIPIGVYSYLHTGNGLAITPYTDYKQPYYWSPKNPENVKPLTTREDGYKPYYHGFDISAGLVYFYKTKTGVSDRKAYVINPVNGFYKEYTLGDKESIRSISMDGKNVATSLGRGVESDPSLPGGLYYWLDLKNVLTLQEKQLALYNLETKENKIIASNVSRVWKYGNTVYYSVNDGSTITVYKFSIR